MDRWTTQLAFSTWYLEHSPRPWAKRIPRDTGEALTGGQVSPKSRPVALSSCRCIAQACRQDHLCATGNPELRLRGHLTSSHLSSTAMGAANNADVATACLPVSTHQSIGA